MARFKYRPISNDASGVKASNPVSVAAATVGTPTNKRRRRGRTNSERGRAYRKRQEEETARLEAQIVALRAAVQEKQFLRGVWEAKCLRSRHSLDGSRVAAVREYHKLLRHGLSAGGQHRLQQEAFVYSIMDPDVDVGCHCVNGPQAVLGQWRLHTSAFARYSGELIGEPLVIGSPECPLVQVRVDVHALVGEPTVVGLFPPQAQAAARRLLSKCMNSVVRFSCRSSFQFTREGRVNFLLVQIDYADGFIVAGMELTDVAELLKLSAITPLSTIAVASPASASASRCAK